MPDVRRFAWLAACATLIALILLGLAWELILAPLKPAGSWLVLKVIPLMAPLFGILRAKRYTFQWSTLLIWFYVAEGAVRMYTDPGRSASLAAMELVLALGYFAAAVVYLKSTRRGAITSVAGGGKG